MFFLDLWPQECEFTLARVKTLLFHPCKCSYIPVSTHACVDRGDHVEAAHVTFSLVLRLRIFIILHLVVLSSLSSFSFFIVLTRVPAFLKVSARWERRLNNSKRSKGTCFHL